MKYNSMTIHCASLCLDVLSQRHFFSYTIPDILAFKPEVICQIGVRLEPVSKELTDERGMTEVLLQIFSRVVGNRAVSYKLN